MKRRTALMVLAGVVAVALAVPASASASTGGGDLATYEVTIKNLEKGQPISPPVVATHDRSVRLFQRGAAASHEIEEIAENGNQGPAVAALLANSNVTDVVDVGVPLTPKGSSAGGFSDSVTVTIDAARGDRLSVAGMLICTNDGIAGVDSLRLPRWGSKTVYARGYDAGTERNTELSEDLVDPCTGLGPEMLDGDPNGNNNDGIETDGRIRRHRGVAGNGDLSDAHDFRGAVAKVTVTRIKTFDVTLTNLETGQPFSPAVAITARPWISIVKPGAKAPNFVEAIAENGDQSGAVAHYSDRRGVTDVVDVGVPLAPKGSNAGGFSDSTTFEITARHGDRLSLATMLICTNDGLVAANRVRLPSHGTVTYYLYGWDAGTERNTELSEDLVDPCSGLGPVLLDGDPNGNNNDGIDTNQRIRRHRGINGGGDLRGAHDFARAVAKLTISSS